MLSFPLNEKIKGIEDVIDEFKDIATYLTESYPNYPLLPEPMKKYIVLKVVTMVIDRLSIDEQATLEELMEAADQDVILISNAIAIVFSEAFNLPKDVKIRTIRLVVKRFISFKITKLLEEIFFGGDMSTNDISYYLDTFVKHGINNLGDPFRDAINFILSDKEIQEIKNLI